MLEADLFTLGTKQQKFVSNSLEGTFKEFELVG